MDDVKERPPALALDELKRLLSAEFPQSFADGGAFVIESIRHGGCCVRQQFRPGMLRPGGTISGPAMMTLTDVAMYVALLASIGWVPLAVTTQLNINFLRKPEPRDLLAVGNLLKLGKRLAVGEVSIRNVGSDDIVAHATATYSIPSRR
jgi:uncharacterized protein (TIGR00369 family)